MSFFEHVNYIEKGQLIEVGSGCSWGTVYSQLANIDRNFVAGVTSNAVGVSDYLLCGGYSLKSNMFGLGIDYISEVEMVLPSGDIVVVNERPGASSKMLKELQVRHVFFSGFYRCQFTNK